MRSVRSRRVQNRESRGEGLVAEQSADFGEQARVRLRRSGRSPQQQSDGERRHARWSATRFRQGVTVSETASSSPRNSSFEWKNQLRFAGSRSPPLTISPSRWMYSPSFADSAW